MSDPNPFQLPIYINIMLIRFAHSRFRFAQGPSFRYFGYLIILIIILLWDHYPLGYHGSEDLSTVFFKKLNLFFLLII